MPCDVESCAFDAGDCQSETPLPMKRPGEWICFGEEEFPRGMEDREMEMFVQDGWGVTPERFCVARVAMVGSFIQIDVGDKVGSRTVKNVVTVETSDCAERVSLIDAVLLAKMNFRGDGLMIITKQSLSSQWWELHLALFVSEKDSDSISFLLLINVVHFAAYGSIAKWIDTGEIPAIPAEKNPKIAWMAFLPIQSSTKIFLKLAIPDIWKHYSIGELSPREFDHVIRTNVSLSIGQFVENGFDWNSNLGVLFDQSDADMFIPIIHNRDIGPKTTIFMGKWDDEGMVTLEVKSPNADLELVHLVHLCTNYDNPASMSFHSWLSKRRAYLGLEANIRDHLSKMSHIRQIRTCFEAMQLKVPKKGIITENATVVFWREFYEMYEVSNSHDEIWNFFLKSKGLSYFAAVEKLVQMEQYFAEIGNSSVIFAIPSIEIVTCSWNSHNQEFFNSPEIGDYYVNREDPTQGFKWSLLPQIRFDESSSVFRYGSIGAVVSMNLKCFQSHMKQYSKTLQVFSDVQKSGQNRRLSDTYRDSLIFTNLQLIRLFGNVKRNVPAHMPHLINKWVMREIESKLSRYVNSTIRHKFRESDDLQYAFLYFHFLGGLMDQAENQNLDRIWREKLDRDDDGLLNSNEFETLAAMVLGDSAGKEEKLKLLECLGENINFPRGRVIPRPPYGSLYFHRSFVSNITLESIRNCSMAATGLAARFPFQGHMETSSDSDVAFQMIQDDLQDLLDQVETWKRGNGVAR